MTSNNHNGIQRSDILAAASGATEATAEETGETVSPYLSLRRPQTTNTQDFWYCSEQTWQDLLVETEDKKTKKVALNRLRKYEAAGIIMETSEGKDSPSPCYYCTRPSDNHTCRVKNAQGELVCAYCKCKGKSGCTAGAIPEDEEMEEEISEYAAMRARVEAAEIKNVALEERISMLEAKLTALDGKVVGLESYCQQWFLWLKNEAVIKSKDVYTLWKGLWPDSDRAPPEEGV